MLPWYANRTLPTSEREAVETLLKTDPEAATQLAAIEAVRTTVTAQPRMSPSPTVRRQLLTRMRAERAASTRLTRPVWAIGSAVTLVLLVVLWLVVQPGIALQWSVAGSGASAYRIYRAPAGSEDFSLLSEVPAQSNMRAYSFTDVTPLPGQTYTYLVEAVTVDGQTSLSPLAVGRGWDVLPAQLALILTSAVVGLLAMLLMANLAQTTNRRLIGA